MVYLAGWFPLDVGSETELSVQERYAAGPWDPDWGRGGKEAAPVRGKWSWEAGSGMAMEGSGIRTGFLSCSELGWDVQAFILLPPALTGKCATLGEVPSATVPDGGGSQQGRHILPWSGGALCVCLSTHHATVILFEIFINPMYPKIEDCVSRLRGTEITFSFELVGQYLEAIHSLPWQETRVHAPAASPRKITRRRRAIPPST